MFLVMSRIETAAPLATSEHSDEVREDESGLQQRGRDLLYSVWSPHVVARVSLRSCRCDCFRFRTKTAARVELFRRSIGAASALKPRLLFHLSLTSGGSGVLCAAAARFLLLTKTAASTAVQVVLSVRPRANYRHVREIGRKKMFRPTMF